MRNEVMFAGFGGQGVVKAALLLAQAAGLYEDKEVAQTQSYGPEARGGACRSEVVISDKEIDYIKPLNVNAFVVMSQPALDKYIDTIDPENTVVIADTTLIASTPEQLAKVYPVKATQVAEQELGQALFANIIMLGALSAITNTISIESLEQSLQGNVPEKTLEKNRKALKRGFEMGNRLKVET
jgi:2-oxoglutarate ferredoxin oxidoreductase subunit gamma